MSNITTKLVEGNVPSTLRVQVVHLHSGNSSRNQRKGHSYVTIAKLRDKVTDEVISEGKAYCSKGDSPRRSVGRAVAVGRALRGFTYQVMKGYEMQSATKAYLDHIPAFSLPRAVLANNAIATKEKSV